MKSLRLDISLIIILSVVLFAAGCDSLTGGDDHDAPLLVSAEATSVTRVLAHFDRPLDPDSLANASFQIGSALENGRGARQGPLSVRYLGRESNTVELTLVPPGLGSGSHSVTARGIVDIEGNTTERTVAEFEYRYEVRTPKAFRVDRIVVTNFPAYKENGNTWDWDPFNAGPRRPDLRVTFYGEGGFPWYFISETHWNVDSNRTYTFDEPASTSDPDVPFDVPFNKRFELSLVDNDTGGDEVMAEAHFGISSYYRLDNATDDALTIRGEPDFTAILHGNWLY